MRIYTSVYFEMVVMDLIKTITEDDEVSDYSGSSDEATEELQPKRKKYTKKQFSKGFEFVSSAAEYNKDPPWDNLYKYIKRKAKSKVDDKIARVRDSLKSRENEEDEVIEVNEEGEPLSEKEPSGSDSSELSEDELVHDMVREKTKTVGKKKMKKLKNKKNGVEDTVESEEDEEEKMKFEEAPPTNEDLTFYEMNLSRPILKAIQEMRWGHPTPIQSAAIPIALAGRDICGCAPTGTGKTGAFMVPTLERLVYKPARTASVTRVLCVVPTRELGVQVYQVTKQLAQFTRVEVALSVGGLEVKLQEAALRKCPDVVIATPGRLIDHLKNTPGFSLDHVEVLILDEADRMLDENFSEQMKEILRCCSRSRQVLLFSATMTEGVKELAALCLNKPVKLGVNTVNALLQEFVRVRNEGDREALLAALVCRTFRENVIIFVQTKKQAHRIHVLLGLLGLRAELG